MVDETLRASDPITYRKKYIEEFAEQSEMTVVEKAMFMARLDHETGGFRYMKELGQPSYFDRYEGRKDLGNIYQGDGFKYRGRGFIQLTGRKNYAYFSPITGADLENYPDIAAREDVAARIAIAYWNIAKVKDGRTIAQAAKEGDVEAVVRGVNGGMNGFNETLTLYEDYLNEYKNG
jgi:putative chitinase